MNSLISISAPRVRDTGEQHLVRSLPILVVHAHSSCNCRCIMCDIWKTRNGRGFRMEQLQPHLDSIRRLGVRWIVFSGGEPLLNAELPDLCAVLRDEGIRLTLLTTGLLLEKRAEGVAAAFDDVIVSLDGPPEIHDDIRRIKNCFRLMQSGIATVRRLQPKIRFTARSTVQKANHAHLRETVIAAKTLGLDGISFLAADLISEAFNREEPWPESRQAEVSLSPEEVGVLANEIEALVSEFSEEIRQGFVMESPNKLRLIARHFRAHLGLERYSSPLCNAPWVSAVIETDGSVRPCFFHKTVGNLQSGTLEQVINGSEARLFRAGLDVPTNPICNRCVCSLNYRT